MWIRNRGKKTVPSWNKFGLHWDVIMNLCFGFFCFLQRTFVEKVMLTFPVDLTQLTTCVPPIHKTHLYNSKANAAGTCSVILAGLKTSLECVRDLWPKSSCLMVKQKLLTLENNAFSRMNPCCSPFFMSTQTWFKCLLNLCMVCSLVSPFQKKMRKNINR